jgi:peptide/nickel transport system permease protein
MNRRQWAWAWLILWFGGSLASILFGHEVPFQLERALAPPSAELLLGADTYGRSLLSLLSGASLLSFGFSAACVAGSIGIALAFAGIAPNVPRRAERILESILQFLLAFPSLLFAFMVAGLLGPGRATIAAALVLGSAPGLSRTLWARSREISKQEFIWAARSLGAGPLRLAFRHYLPHLASVARVKIPSMLAHALVAEASLSFLGLGFPVGEESWGSLLAQAKDYLIEAPHISLGVGLPLVLSLLALDAVSKPAHGE